VLSEFAAATELKRMRIMRATATEFDAEWWA
jgi:hypothetical protein